jgi:hypothetical protein
MVTKLLPDIVEKTKGIGVISTFASCSFDLWMFCAGFDTFAIICELHQHFMGALSCDN